MGCQCSQPNKDKQVLIEQNKQIVPEEDSNSKSNMNINPQIDNNEKEKEKKEETPQVLSSNPEPPKEEKKEEPTTPKEQENKDPNIEVIKEDNQPKEEPKPIEQVKVRKQKYDISKYPKDVFDLINRIRDDPPKFVEDIEKAISLIKEDSGKLIYSGKLKVALNRGEPLFREVILSRSRWLVGSSNIKKLGSSNIILDNIHLTFSPPDNTLASFKASSPENNILPKNPLI